MISSIFVSLEAFRLKNSALQKQVLFDVRCPGTTWTRIGKVLGVDVHQVRRMTMAKADFKRLLDDS